MGAICLFVIGIPTIHSDWPPLNHAVTHFAIADAGKQLLVAAAVFSAFAVVYLAFPLIFRREISSALGEVHFWMSALAVLLEFALTYWFNLTFKTRPDESRLDIFFHAFGASLDATSWAIYVFLLAQVIFVVNLLWSAFKGTAR